MNSSLNLQKELEIDFDFLKKKKSYSFLQDHLPANKWVNWISRQKKSNVLKKNSTKSIKKIEQARLKELYGSGYSKIHELKLVKIEMASAGKIKEWAEKILPNGKTFGEVTNANTLHYKTFKPHKGGLFCERIFGPLKDFECACGIRSKPTIKMKESKKILEHEQTIRSFCPNCDVEYTWSVIRRYQLGYIQLVSPVSHIWFLKANPSYLSLLLDLRRSHLESIIYCTEAITLENFWKSSQNLGLDTSPATLYSVWQKLIKADQEALIRQKNFISGSSFFKKPAKEKQKLKTRRFRFLFQKTSSPFFFGNYLIEPKEKGLLTQEIAFLGAKSKEVVNGDEMVTSISTQTFTKKNSLNMSIFLKNAILSENQTKNFIEIYVKIVKTIYKEIYFQVLNTKKKYIKLFGSILIKNFKLKKTFYDKALLNTNFLKKLFKRNQVTWTADYDCKLFPLAVTKSQPVAPLAKPLVATGGARPVKDKKLFLVLKNKNTLFESFFQIYLISLLNSATMPSLKGPFIGGQNFKLPHLKKFVEISSLNKNKILISLLENEQNQKTSLKKLFSEFLIFSLAKREWSLFICKQKILKEFNFLFNKKMADSDSSKHSKKKIVNLSYKIKKTIQMENGLYYYSGTSIENKRKKILFFLEKKKKISINLKKFQINNNFGKTKEIVYKIQSQLDKISGNSETKISVTKAVSANQITIKNPRTIKQFSMEPFSSFTFLRGDQQADESQTRQAPVNTSSWQQSSQLPSETGCWLLRGQYKKVIEQKNFLDLKKFFFCFKTQKLKFSEIKKNFFWIKNKNFFYQIKIQQMKSSFVLQKIKDNKKQTSFQDLKTPCLSTIIFLNNKKKKLLQRKKEFAKQKQKSIRFKKFKCQSSFSFVAPLVAKQPAKTRDKSVKKTFLKASNVTRLVLSNDQENASSKETSFINYKTDESFSTVNKLKNHCYTVSYNHLWALNSDWKSFFYFNSAPKDFEDLKFPYICQKKAEFSLKKFDLLASNLLSPNTSYPGTSYPSTKSPVASRLVTPIDFFSKIAIPLTGAAMVKKLLSEYEPLELDKMAKQHQNLIPKLNRSIRQFKEKAKKKSDFVKIQKLLNKRDHIIKRLKLIRKFKRKNVDPTSMILSVLPVLPPDLRPILKLQNQIAASDLNRLYQRILYRNERLKKFLKDPSTSQSFEMKYAQRLLQEAVDNLIQNGKGKVKPETNSRGQPLKSLSEILKGKQGRFRQYLLGKRVDYSGRSVIVVGPKLKIYQCGLPKEMALELFLPFLIKRVLHYKIARTVVGAKNFLDSNKKFTWNLLNEIMKNHPVLLNRAPTLHRLGIQAFQPKLVEGRAILLHPLVCPAFNADFDGDQMAVHVPLTLEARAEAWTLMFSRNHLISPATGEPILLPSQDMVLGCYYLTSEKIPVSKSFSLFTPAASLLLFKKASKVKQSTSKSLLAMSGLQRPQGNKIFSNFEQILNAYQLGHISLQSTIWIKWNGKIQFSKESFNMMEIRLNIHATRYWIQSKAYRHFDKTGKGLTQYVRTTPGRILMNSIAQKCIFA